MPIGLPSGYMAIRPYFLNAGISQQDSSAVTALKITNNADFSCLASVSKIIYLGLDLIVTNPYENRKAVEMFDKFKLDFLRFDKFKLDFLRFPLKLNNLVKADVETDGETPNNKLPAKIYSDLNKTIANLSNYPPYLSAVQTALQTALENWQNHLDAPNSLVILGAPVLPLSEIMNEAIAQWQHKKLFEMPLKVRSLQLSARPHDFEYIQKSLENQLSKISHSPELAGEVTASEEVLDSRHTIVVVSRLDWCFLRCIDGLDPIEYLRNLTFKDSSVFWLIGCNDWAWRYLDFIFQVSAYFDRTVSLPKAQGEDLKLWLQPVLDKINLENYDEFSSDKLAEVQKSYFQNLSDNSSGISSVAASLWLRSLRYEWNSDTETPENDFQPPFSLKQNKPKLPDLPNLISEDRYILYSLLLHGGMTLSQLALSLGEDESPVKARVQVLVQANVIDRSKSLLFINPAFYPKLKNLLYTNNFLVDN